MYFKIILNTVKMVQIYIYRKDIRKC